MPVHYRVHEAAIASFNAPGQPVYEDVVWRTAQTTRTLAVLYAPSRTGRLKASIRASRPKPVGQWRLSSSVSASIGYAIYVHDGTTGPITAKGGQYLKVPYRPGRGKKSGNGFFLTASVAGQKANPFLADAMKQALRTNEVLQYRVS